METPEKINPKNLADYLDVMSKSVFQAGISWQVVNNKWPGIKETLHGFDPVAISNLQLVDIDKLLDDRRIIRNRRKIEAIIHNARTIIELNKKYNGFQNYLRSHAGFQELVKDIRKQFKFLGEMGVYHFLLIVGEEVPSYE